MYAIKEKWRKLSENYHQILLLHTLSAVYEIIIAPDMTISLTEKVLIFYLFLHKNIHCEYSLMHITEALLMSTHMFSCRNKENIYLDTMLIIGNENSFIWCILQS